jgi:hypothetical protein
MALATNSKSTAARGVAATCEQDGATPLFDHLTRTERGRPERLPVGVAGLVIASTSAALWWLIARLVW